MRRYFRMALAFALFSGMASLVSAGEIVELGYVRNRPEFQAAVQGAVARGLTTFSVPVRNEGGWFSLGVADEVMRGLDFLAEGACPWYARSRYTLTGTGPRTRISFSLEYRLSGESLNREVEAADAEAAALAAAAAAAAPDPMGRLLYLHDSLTARARYDHREAAALPPEAYTPYGSLVAGLAVCDGFSKAFLLAAGKLGLECRLVKGVGYGEAHSWNLVRLEGAWYHVDVTYDLLDPPYETTRAHFLVDDNLMARSHQWDRSLYPACVDDRADPFSLAGQAVENFTEAYAWLQDRVGRDPGRFELRIRNFALSTFRTEAVDLVRRALWGRAWSLATVDDAGVIVLLVRK